MIHSVRFLPHHVFWREPEYGRFLGRGRLLFQETGLIIDGRILRVRMPILDNYYEAFISAPGMRTIPYSAITSHRPGRPWGLWIVAAVVGLAAALVLVAPTFDLLSKSAFVIALATIILALLIAKPTYIIEIRNSHGKIDRLRIAVKTRSHRRILAEDVDGHIADVKELIRSPFRPLPTAKAICVDALRRAWVWGFAGLLTALVMHAVFSSISSTRTIATSPAAVRAENLFYSPGRQIYAFISGLTPDSAPKTALVNDLDGKEHMMLQVWGITPESIPDAPAFFRADGATLTTIFLVTIAGCLVGVFFALSQSKNFVAPKKTVPKVVYWLPLLATLSFTGWLAYSLKTTPTDNLPPLEQQAAVRLDADHEELVVQIMIDTRRMETYGLTVAAVGQALSRHNVEFVEEGHDSTSPRGEVLVIRNMGKLENIEQSASVNRLEEFVVADINGQPICIRDIALVMVAHDVRLKPEPPSAVASMNLAQQFDELGRYEIARGHYDEAIRLFADIQPVVHAVYDGPGVQQPIDYHVDVFRSQLPEKAICYSDSAANLLALSRWGEAHSHAIAALAILDEIDGQKYAGLELPIPSEARQKANRRTKTMAVQLALSQSWYWGLMLLPAAVIAWNAGRLGFSSWLWLTITACCGFPMAMLPVLGSLPDPRLEQRRLSLRQLLKESYQGPTSKLPSHSIPEQSLGDQTTQDPNNFQPGSANTI